MMNKEEYKKYLEDIAEDFKEFEMKPGEVAKAFNFSLEEEIRHLKALGCHNES